MRTTQDFVEPVHTAVVVWHTTATSSV